MHFTLSDLVTDITQNAAESGASLVELEIRETYGPETPVVSRAGEFRFIVRDNGKGMSRQEQGRVVDPFVTDGKKHPHRKVGLGIPFLIQTAEQSGGGWELRSEKGQGTTISAWFDMANVDTPPQGDLPGMFRTILLFEGPGEVYIRRFRNGGGAWDLKYEIRKTELAEALGGLEDTSSLVLLDQYLRSLEEDKDEDIDNETAGEA
ncbi:MAG: sensor histidine kinase [Treponema sp.]|nr:sensor histidine kinase [Treponema sp.]